VLDYIRSLSYNVFINNKGEHEMNTRLIALKRMADNKGLEICLKSPEGEQLAVPVEQAMKYVAIRTFKILADKVEATTVLKKDEYLFHFGNLV
jgi:hypothetical protein